MNSTWGPPELIALDIDGTILRTGRPVSPPVLAAVRNALASGTHVVLATGRPVIGTLPVLKELDLIAGSALCSNGAVRMDAASGGILEVHRFDAGPVVHNLRSLLPGALFAIEQVGEGNLVTGPFPASDLAVLERLVDHATLVAEPVTRLTVWWNGHTVDEMARILRSARLAGVNWVLDRTGPWLVAVPAGVSKGTALEKLRIELGVAAQATLAVGDGDNDVEMLRWAAYGVAMGHAPANVRAAAHDVTGTVDEDGLASVLERWYA